MSTNSNDLIRNKNRKVFIKSKTDIKNEIIILALNIRNYDLKIARHITNYDLNMD